MKKLNLIRLEYIYKIMKANKNCNSIEVFELKSYQNIWYIINFIKFNYIWIDFILISIVLFNNKSLTISKFPFSTATCNGVW